MSFFALSLLFSLFLCLSVSVSPLLLSLLWHLILQVFGLGNKTYEKYNEVAQVLNTRLSEMGGQELYELGLGDDDGNLEEDFSAWKDDMWPALCAHFGLSFTEDNSASERRYRLVTPPADAQAFAGEFKTPGSFDNQRG